MGCMFKCISYVFGAGPPRSLDLLGVGNPGKKRQLGIGTVLQYPMICTSKKHDDISSTSLVITVIYVYYMSYMYVWLWWWTINTAYILHIQYMSLHSRTTRLNLKMMASKRILLFQGLIFRFHVKLQGCTQRLSVPFIQQNIVSSRIVWLTHVLNQAKLRTAGLKPLTTLFHTFPGFSVS